LVTVGQPNRVEELRGHAAMLTFSALVAGSFSLGGRIANDIDPAALTALRFLVAALVIGLAAVLTGSMNRKALRAPWRYLILGGLFGFYFVLMFEGLKTATPVSTAAVFTLTPLLAAGFGWWIMSQITTRGMALALTLGASGALWVIFRGDLDALLALKVGRGEVIYFVGCIAHAVYIPLIPKLSRGEGVLAFTFFILVAGALVVGLVGAGRIAATDWSALPLRVWLVLGYLVFFASGVSITILQYASLRLKAAKVMAYTYLTPSFVILWEIALDGEIPTAILLPGIGLTMIALVILLREGRVSPVRSAA
jgi:drug/metabolite transporter (DMT)-like permease